jgi:hypothetical protein
MKTLKDILSNYGYMNSDQLKEIAEHFPAFRVVIKWGGLPRERLPAWEAISRIKSVEDQNIDYCREVFISGTEYNALKQAFNIAD